MSFFLTLIPLLMLRQAKDAVDTTLTFYSENKTFTPVIHFFMMEKCLSLYNIACA